MNDRMTPERQEEAPEEREIMSRTATFVRSNATSERIYGQEQQKEQLIKAFERSCGQCNDGNNQRPELTVIAGSSGSGKTVLARMLQEHAKHFVLGKCDQFQQGSEPFGPFIVALTQLANSILQDDTDTMIQRVQSIVECAISDSSQVKLLVDMVPALAGFFERKYNDLNTIRSGAMQHPDVENPILDIVCSFLRSICSMDRNIVMVIDDIQWIDSSSLELLKKLTEQEKPIPGFMLVTTCRDDEMTDDNPAQQVLKNLKEENNDAPVLYISLGNLTLEAIGEIASDRFPTVPEMGIAALSSVLYQHTKGNAFFVTQLMRRLENSGWRTPTNQEEMKDWDFDDHRSMVDRFIKYDCDALVDFLVVDTANESPLIRQVLKVASCLGSNFAASHVTMIVDGSKTDILDALSLMEDRGIIHRRRGKKDGNDRWSWTHDKYQKAAYLLINKPERNSFHLNIGRQLLPNLDKNELQRFIFIVVSQFGISLKLIDDDGEKETVANLFLQAGKKSAASSSFDSAASYFSMGTSLLKEDNWTSQYNLSLRLYIAAAEMECFRGRFQQTDKLVNVILRHTKTLKDQIRAYEIKIYMLGAKQETAQVTYLTLEVLKRLGESFPAKPRFPKVLFEILSTKYLLSNKTEADILSLPPLKDWKKIAIQQVTQLAFPALIRGNPELAVLISCRCMKLTLRHGICGMSCGAFLTVGTVIIYPLGFIEEAIRLVTISEKIIEKFGVDEMRCRQQGVYHVFTLPYKYPLRDMVDPLERAGHLCLMTGDVDISCQCFLFRAVTTIFCGWDLGQVLSMATEYTKNFQSWRQQLHVSMMSIVEQATENLMNRDGDHPYILMGRSFNEDDWIEKSKKALNDQEAVLFWLCKAFIALHLGEYTMCRGFMATLAKQNLNISTAAMFQQINFIAALIDVLLAREGETRNGRKLKSRKAMDQLRTYAKIGPDNIMHKIYLIEAEKAVLKNDRGTAKSNFGLSIDHANRQGFVHEEAMAYERFAVAMFEWDEVTESLEFFERARCLYSQWGSSVKVKRLEEYVREKCGVNNMMWNDGH